MRESEIRTLQHLDINNLLEAVIDYSKGQDISFACWKLPNEDMVRLMIQFSLPVELKSIDIQALGQGFLFAPFKTEERKLFIKNDLLLSWKSPSDIEIDSNSKGDEFITFINEFVSSNKNPINLIDDQPNPNSFKELISLSISGINDGKFNKVVPSRFRKISFKGEFDHGEVYKQLINKYPSAFVSAIYTPNSGFWMGASPELLISTNNNIFQTVALAGTQKYNPDQPLADTAWTQKEIEEQALVSRYIINCFKKIRLREFEEHGPKTIKAGNLIHLKTEFKVNMNATNFPELGSTMLELLHPTSAVCGMPMQNAQDFLLRHEGYNREFYSGFLGPVNVAGLTSQYVNLRCMKVNANEIILYAGAGVTEDSNPEKEWIETELKMNTLFNVIKSN